MWCKEGKRRTFPLISGHGLYGRRKRERGKSKVKRRSEDAGVIKKNGWIRILAPRVVVSSSSTFANAQMVYIPSWQQFQEAAENLYEKSPNSVSYDLPLPHADAC